MCMDLQRVGRCVWISRGLVGVYGSPETSFMAVDIDITEIDRLCLTRNSTTMGDRDAATMRVIEELKRIYKSKIMPLEKLYQFDLFHSPIMTDAEFDSKPQVMLIGQYSVGKTTFIRYLLGKDFPGVRIGPGKYSLVGINNDI